LGKADAFGQFGGRERGILLYLLKDPEVDIRERIRHALFPLITWCGANGSAGAT
jgi:hypothetical protein